MSEGTITKNKTNYRVDIYIGSDNDSGKIQDSYLDKIRKWANEAFPDGYTFVKGEGYHNGAPEDSILLHAFLNYDPTLRQQLERLKRELKQESILVVKSIANYEMI
jgi:hypothetical protein